MNHISPWESKTNVGTFDPRKQLFWYRSTSTGNDHNDGLTSSTPVKTHREIRSRWQAAQNGGRVELAGVQIQIVEMDSDTDPTDCASDLLDVDQQDGGTLLIRPLNPLAALHSGTLTTVSAFARTSAQGQVVITDAGTADFTPYIGKVIRASNGSVANIAAAPAPNTAICSPFKQEIVLSGPGLSWYAGTPPDDLAPANGDTYAILALPVLSWGMAFTYRSVQAWTGASPLNSPACGPYRCELSLPGGATERVDGYVAYRAAECQYSGNGGEHWTDATNGFQGGVGPQSCTHAFFNCSMVGNRPMASGGHCFVAAGISDGPIAQAGGAMVVDCDHAIYGDPGGNLGAVRFGYMRVGTASRWDSASGPACRPLYGGLVQFRAGYFGIQKFYGTVAGGQVVDVWEAASASYDGSAVAAFDFGGGEGFTWHSASNPSIGVAQEVTTGVWTGGIANTMANLDAAIGVGGFGGSAMHPPSGAFFRQRGS